MKANCVDKPTIQILSMATVPCFRMMADYSATDNIFTSHRPRTSSTASTTRPNCCGCARC